MAFIKFLRDKNIADSELVTRYRHSYNTDYIGELFKRYTHLVYGVCMKYLENEEKSKDAVMEIFEQLLVDLKKHDVDNFKAWLYSVAKNYCLLKRRREKLQADNQKDYEKTENIFMESDELLHLRDEDGQEKLDKNLYDGIEELKEEQKKCIELYFMQNKTYEEVSEITGYTIKEVKSYLQNGKRNLKIFLTERKKFQKP